MDNTFMCNLYKWAGDYVMDFYFLFTVTYMLLRKGVTFNQPWCLYGLHVLLSCKALHCMPWIYWTETFDLAVISKNHPIWCFLIGVQFRWPRKVINLELWRKKPKSSRSSLFYFLEIPTLGKLYRKDFLSACSCNYYL